MKRAEITQLIGQYAARHPGDRPELVETHISWVLLARSEVFKIKKPLKLSFLDFSTLEGRKHFCEQEVVLNRRLAPDMYLGVIPIREGGVMDTQGSRQGPVVEYAVWMRRIDESRQLDRLLEQGGVTPADMVGLARMLADFHRQARVVARAEDWQELYREFEDLRTVMPVLESCLGAGARDRVAWVLDKTKSFLENLDARIEARKKAGFVRDGHGDLHCRNIFMTHPPVIFDCIEFSEELRTLDVLSEIGFLCMDLERLGREDLSEAFSREYQRHFRCVENDEDRSLLLFYKMYRANVRMKVTALAMGPKPLDAKMGSEALDQLQGYYRMFEAYALSLFPS